MFAKGAFSSKGWRVLVSAVVGAIAAGIALGGCGDDSSTGAESAAPLTKPQFIKQASQICEHGLQEKDRAVTPALQRLAAESKGIPSPRAVEEIAEEAIFPPYRKIIEQLGELQPPQGEEVKVEAIVGDFESGLKAAEANPAKAAKENLFVDANQAAEDYGFHACSL